MLFSESHIGTDKTKPLKSCKIKMQSSQQVDKKIQEEHRSAGNEIVYSYFNPPSISGVSADRKRWTILFAEMQSGKTFTFLFVSFEMLSKKMVDKVIIFSGNRETGLRAQTEEARNKFVKHFRNHLRKDADFRLLSEEERNDKLDELDEIVHKIEIVWGCELKDQEPEPMFQMIPSNTLFVFEESHFAQNRGMQVDKYLTKMGISATGEGLEASGNYVLSVSATPISELSDVAHDAQTKGLVYLKPGQGYFGLSTMCNNGNLFGYDVSKWKDTLDSAMESVNRRHPFCTLDSAMESVNRSHPFCFGKYALLRLTKKKSPKKSGGAGGGGRRRRQDSSEDEEDEEEDTAAVEEAKAIARKHNWDIRFHDSIPHTEERQQINIRNPEIKDKKKMKKALKDLNDVPERHTLVLLKGKCRMGHDVPKQHIEFVMETSQNPNTDVVLQSLLGRMCGYHVNRNVMIYLSNKIIRSPEFAKYLAMVRDISSKEKITVLPNKARNIRPLKSRATGGAGSDEDNDEDHPELNKIIPLRFPGLALSQDGQSIIDKIVIKQKIWDHFNDINVQNCENLNSPEQYQDIQTTIVEENNGPVGFRVSRVNNNHALTYKLIPEVYRKAFDTRSVPSLPPACAPNREGVIPRLFVFGELDDYHGFQKGDVFLDIRISTGPSTAAGGGGDAAYSPAELKRIPTTNRREIFGHALETGETIFTNGSMLIGLRPESHCNVELMKQGLREFIQLSLQPCDGIMYPRRINSVTNKNGESAGIYMTQEVYDTVKPGGRVFCEIQAEFNVDLVLKKGKEKLKLADRYIFKFVEISW